LRNINALVKAFQKANIQSVMAIAKKLGAVLCIFQNLFVLLSIFNTIIQIIKDILSLAFALPPCDDGNNSGCCTADVCPAIIKNGSYTKTTGTFQYLNGVGAKTTLMLPSVGPSTSSDGYFTVALRPESWQIYEWKDHLDH